jgi:hypothetical protein
MGGSTGTGTPPRLRKSHFLKFHSSYLAGISGSPSSDALSATLSSIPNSNVFVLTCLRRRAERHVHSTHFHCSLYPHSLPLQGFGDVSGRPRFQDRCPASSRIIFYFFFTHAFRRPPDAGSPHSGLDGLRKVLHVRRCMLVFSLRSSSTY